MSDITLTFPDGAKRSYPSGITGKALAEGISKSLAKRAVAMRVDGRLADLADPIEKDASVKIVTRTDPEALELIRHDAAHVMAEAVQALWPGTQVTIGPGDRERLLLRLRQGGAVPPRRPRPDRSQDARDHRSQRALHQGVLEPPAGQGLLQEEGRAVQDRAGRRHSRGRGPQDLQAGRVARSVPRPAHDLDRPDRQGVQAHPLRRLLLARQRAGAEAAAHLRHRLGDRAGACRSTSSSSRRPRSATTASSAARWTCSTSRRRGRASVFWHPKGWTLFQSLINYMRRRQNAAGYREVNGPQILDKAMWETSGHWETFRENMFTTVTEDKREFAIKPMNCPGHVQIFKHGLRSYRELPYPHRRVRHRAPLRAVGRAARPDARARLHAGRCAHLLHRGADGRRVPEDQRPHLVDLSRLRLRRGGGQALDPAREARRRRRAVGSRGGCHVGGAGRDPGDFERQDQDRHQPGRGRLLRPQVRVRAARRHRPRLAVRHDPGRLQPAGAVRRLLHRRRRREEDAGDDPPRHLRLAGALHRHPARELRRASAAVAGAGAGDGVHHRVGRRRLRRGGAGRPEEGRPARRDRSCATRRSTTRCASTRWPRCRSCWWSASARPRRRPCRCAAWASSSSR